MTDSDDPNPYALPSAYPRMPRQPIRITDTGGRPIEPARPPLRTADSTAAILSGSAVPMGRPAAPAPRPEPQPQPAPPPEPVVTEAPPAASIPPMTVSTLEIIAPNPVVDQDDDVDWMRPPPRPRAGGIPAWAPTAVALAVAVAGVAVLLVVSNRPAPQTSAALLAPPAAPALSASPPAPTLLAPTPAPAVLPSTVPAAPARLTPPRAAARPAIRPAAPTAAAPAPVDIPPPAPVIATPPPQVVAQPPPQPAGPPPKPAPPPPSDPNAPIATHVPG